MKVISFALFDSGKERFEFMAYLRGIYFNARMNKLIYPDWKTFVVVSRKVEATHYRYLVHLRNLFDIQYIALDSAPLCKAMLWRMMPLFAENLPTHVLCRDADAITTYREAQAVNEWLKYSELGFHGITDNPAHTIPMMGGMIGFKTEAFRKHFPEWKTFEDMVSGLDLSKHGSDQTFLMNSIYAKIHPHMLGHFFAGLQHSDEVKVRHSVEDAPLPNVSPRLWESNLTCRHIGSSGVVEMELLRFFKRHDKNQYDDFENEFSNVCYWKR